MWPLEVLLQQQSAMYLFEIVGVGSTTSDPLHIVPWKVLQFHLETTSPKLDEPKYWILYLYLTDLIKNKSDDYSNLYKAHSDSNWWKREMINLCNLKIRSSSMDVLIWTNISKGCNSDSNLLKGEPTSMYMFSFLLEEATCEGSILKNCRVLSRLYSVGIRKDQKKTKE